MDEDVSPTGNMPVCPKSTMKLDIPTNIIGSSHTLTQLCFNRNDLNKQNFNVDHFLRTARRCGATIEQIQADLRLYLKFIQNAMVELINEDYADFVNLSSNLVNLRRILDKLDSDITSMGSELDEYTLEIRDAAGQIGEHLSAGRDAAVRREALHRRMRLIKILIELRGAIVSRQATTSSGGDFQCITDQFIELNALKKQLMNSDIDLDKETQSKVAQSLLQCSEEFHQLLSTSAISAIRNMDPEKFEIILTAYEACGRLDSLVALFIAEFLEPALNESCYSRWPTHVNKPSQLAEHLAELLRQCTALRTKYMDGLCKTVATQNVSSLVRRSVLTCLLNSMVDGGIFARILLPVEADAFASAVASLTRFCAEWKKHCGDDVSMLHMVQSRFNFTVYVRLRTQNIKRFADGVLPPSNAKNLNLLLHSSEEHKCTLKVHECVQEHLQAVHFQATSCLLNIWAHLWNPEVCLPQATAQFWKLSMEFLGHYEKWYHTAIEAVESSSTDKSSEGVPSNDTNSLGEKKSGAIENRVNGVKSDDSILPKTLTNRLMLTAEVNLVETALYDLAINLIWPITRKLHLDSSPMGECIAHGLKSLNCAAAQLVQRLQQGLAEVMVECVARVSHVPRQYRWTRRSAPTGPSDYVDTLRRVCDQWTVLASRSSLDTSLRRGIATHSFTLTAARYETDARTVLTSVDKMASSLSKLKRGSRQERQGGEENCEAVNVEDGEGKAMSDDAKIRLQIAHDVRALCALARDFCAPDLDQELAEKLEKLTQLSVVGDNL